MQFLHPCKKYTIRNAGDEFGLDILKLLRNHYTVEDILDIEEENNELCEDDNLYVWKRLQDEKCFTLRPRLYRCDLFPPGGSDKDSSVFAGCFIGSRGEINVWYGRTLLFIQHRACREERMLVLLGWANNITRVGEEQQVYANMARRNAHLFTGAGIDKITCVVYPISAIEAVKQKTAKTTVRRTFFLDEMRAQNKTLEDDSRFKLRGIARRQT